MTETHHGRQGVIGGLPGEVTGPRTCVRRVLAEKLPEIGMLHGRGLSQCLLIILRRALLDNLTDHPGHNTSVTSRWPFKSQPAIVKPQNLVPQG